MTTLPENDRRLLASAILDTVRYYHGQGWHIVSASHVVRGAMLGVALGACGLPAPKPPTGKQVDPSTDLILDLLVELCTDGLLLQPESSGGFRLPDPVPA